MRNISIGTVNNMKWIKRGKNYFSMDGRFEMWFAKGDRDAWIISRVDKAEWGEVLMEHFEIITSRGVE